MNHLLQLGRRSASQVPLDDLLSRIGRPCQEFFQTNKAIEVGQLRHYLAFGDGAGRCDDPRLHDLPVARLTVYLVRRHALANDAAHGFLAIGQCAAATRKPATTSSLLPPTRRAFERLTGASVLVPS